MRAPRSRDYPVARATNAVATNWGLPGVDARQILRAIAGTTIPTMTGRPNRILAIAGDDVIVATDRSPNGQAVPIEWVQTALDRLERDGEIEVSVPSIGYRSAFIGAVLQTLPGASATTRPRRIVLTRSRGRALERP